MKKIEIKEKDVLLVVDVQNDFCPGGALAVPNGDKIIEPINLLIPKFKIIILSVDWHPANHCSFKENGGKWPAHCVQKTKGAQIHKALKIFKNRADDAKVFIFSKGFEKNKEAYSVFDGKQISWVNPSPKGSCLDEFLKHYSIKKVFICGLATDYCVKATVVDGLILQYKIYVILDAIQTVDINPGDGQQALSEMKQAGAKLIKSCEIH